MTDENKRANIAAELARGEQSLHAARVLIDAGLLLDGRGLHPTSDGARVKFSAGSATVIDGPFTEAKELIAGYWLIQAKSRDEVIEWIKRAPFAEFTKAGGEVEVQIRQLYELEELGDSPAVHRARALEERIHKNRT